MNSPIYIIKLALYAMLGGVLAACGINARDHFWAFTGIASIVIAIDVFAQLLTRHQLLRSQQPPK